MFVGSLYSAFTIVSSLSHSSFHHATGGFLFVSGFNVLTRQLCASSNMFCCYFAFFLKLHPICFSFSPSLILFAGDLPFIFYDNREVVTSHDLYSLLHLYSGAIFRLANIRSMSICSHCMLCSRFFLFHLGTRGCICWGFSPAFQLLYIFLFLSTHSTWFPGVFLFVILNRFTQVSSPCLFQHLCSLF